MNLNLLLRLILILLLPYNIIQNVYGQENPLVPLENAAWEYTYGDPGADTHIYQYIIGDTVINDTVYTKFTKDTYYQFAGMIDLNSKGSRSYYIRIDSGKIYRRYYDIEKLVFNSNWKEDDTLVGPDQDFYIVSDVDSIEFAGKMRKRWEFICPSQGEHFPAYFIEGIGGYNFDLIEPVFKIYWEGSGGLLCFKHNDEILFNEFCNFCTSSAVNTTNSSLLIYPNPASGTLYIDLSSDYCINLFKIKIFDLTGNLVFEDNINGPQIYPYSIPTDFNGLYIVKIQYQNQIITTKVYINQSHTPASNTW